MRCTDQTDGRKGKLPRIPNRLLHASSARFSDEDDPLQAAATRNKKGGAVEILDPNATQCTRSASTSAAPLILSPLDYPHLSSDRPPWQPFRALHSKHLDADL